MQEPYVLDFRVKGVTFEGRQEVVKAVPRATQIALTHVRDNPADGNAVAVICQIDGQWYQAGYVPKELAQWVASLLDQGRRITIERWHVGGSFDRPLGLRIWASIWPEA